MPVRCPKCSFESADDAAWCDFCKEPFRKKGASAAPAPAAPAAPPVPAAPAAPIDPDVLLKMGDGEKLPTLPPWARTAAWAFLGAVFVLGMAVTGALFARSRMTAQDEPQTLRSQ